MKTKQKLKTIPQLILCLLLPIFSYANSVDSLSIGTFINSFEREIAVMIQQQDEEILAFQTKMNQLEAVIADYPNKTTDQQFLIALQSKLRLLDAIEEVKEKGMIDISQHRFKKGLELLKMLYEKILGLDHHFSSLQTYHNVFELSNPNAYPKYKRNKDQLAGRLKKKNKVALPNMLQSNVYLSTAFTLVSAILGDADSSEKEADLNEISCILDFTVRMHSDLNTIYYETEFLTKGNESLKKECETLFEDYVEVLGYTSSLERCRKTDDWEAILELLDTKALELTDFAKKSDLIYQQKVQKGISDLIFSVDRLMTFMNSYNDFINQGEKYYQKFAIIMSNYQNEKICIDELPYQFSTLKKDIELSITKFNDAYSIAELKGSKLKDLLYGD